MTLLTTMENPKYQIRRHTHQQHYLHRRHSATGGPIAVTACPWRKQAMACVLRGRRLGASKNSPYVGSFRHAPPTSFRSMEASPELEAAMSLLLLPPKLRPSLSSSSSSSSSSSLCAIPMRNSPYVGWFRHAPPSTATTTSATLPCSSTTSAMNHNKKFNIHKVDPDFLDEIDRWHKTLAILLREGYGHHHGMDCYDHRCHHHQQQQRCHPSLDEMISGKLVGGSGKNRTMHCHNSNRSTSTEITPNTTLNDPCTKSAAIQVISRLTSWILFPLICDDDDHDDVSLCETANGLKLVAANATGPVWSKDPSHRVSEFDSSEQEQEEDDDDDDEEEEDDHTDDDSSSMSSASSLGDVPARIPPALSAIDASTQREFSDMNVSVSEIAEAYYAHQLLEQEHHHRRRRSSSSCTDAEEHHHNKPRSGLFTSDVEATSNHHRLDYEITQMDIARMARNASRHLDVDSILNLPTITYRKGSTVRMQHQQQTNRPGRPKSSHAEDGWSFVMVSGVKSTMQALTKSGRDIDVSRETEVDSDDGNDDVCVICLETFQDGDRLRVLPCDHSFHVGCIDRWLSGSHSHNECYTAGCPTCKKRPSPGYPQRDMQDDDNIVENDTPHAMDGSVPSWAFAKLGSAMAMSQEC